MNFTNFRASFVSRTGLILSCLLLAGCSSYGVGLAHMLLGNPKVKSDFSQLTGVDLEEDAARPLMILCSAPHSVTADFPGVQYDIIDGVARRLKAKGINIIPPDEVAEWLDDNGTWREITDVATPLKAGFVAHLDLAQLSWREEGSKTLFRGRTFGHLRVYRMEYVDEAAAVAHQVFDQEFTDTYPFAPVSAESTSEDMFRRGFIKRLCDQVAMRFYDHEFSDKIN